ncbi:MAG: VOC family protein [Chthoniobacterales bacterium]
MVDDVAAAVTFYGEKSSGRRPTPDGARPVPGGWNRILLPVENIEAEVAQLRAAGVKFRRDDIVTGPGGSQIWLEDPFGNLVELFQAKK